VAKTVAPAKATKPTVFFNVGNEEEEEEEPLLWFPLIRGCSSPTMFLIIFLFVVSKSPSNKIAF
jgi:hypothetical protein